MRSNIRTMTLAAAALTSSTSLAQSVPPLAEQKTQAEIDKLRAETEKVIVDTGKSRIDVDNAALQALRVVPNAGASVGEAGKTAEVAILRRIMMAGASAKVVDALAVLSPNPDASVQPEIIVGSTPPSIDQWLWFDDHSAKVKGRLERANASWDKAALGLKSAVAVSAIVALAATILPMLKTETTMTGIDSEVDAVELRHIMYAALKAKGYGVNDAELTIQNPVEATRTLLEPLEPAHTKARDNLNEFNATGSPSMEAPGEALRAAIAEYDKLKDALEKQEAGKSIAVAVIRQRDLAASAANRPLVYLIKTKLAATAMTKKGFFTGIFGDVPAYAYGTAVFDYAIVKPSNVSQRGTVSCTVAKRRMAELMTQRPETLASTGAAICGVDAKTALPISS